MSGVESWGVSTVKNRDRQKINKVRVTVEGLRWKNGTGLYRSDTKEEN